MTSLHRPTTITGGPEREGPSRRPGALLAGMVLALVAGGCAQDDLTAVEQNQTEQDHDWTVVHEQDEDAARYSGVLSYRGACTGFVIDTPGTDDSPAYMATNAHCLQQYVAPEQTLTDLETRQDDAVFLFPYAAADPPAIPTVKLTVRSIPYATYRGTDLAIVELDITKAELIDELGVQPLVIDDQPARVDEAIEIVGIPIVGGAYLSPREECGARSTCLHRAECTIEAIVDVREGERLDSAADWMSFFWNDSYRVHCDLVVGFSGGPTLAPGRGTVVGIANTGVSPRQEVYGPIPGTPPTLQEDCTRGRPCEIDADGTVHLVEANYSAKIHDVPGCFDDSGRFDLQLAGCSLPKP